MSRISKLHYYKLIFRSGLFLAALISYIVNRLHNTNKVFSGFEDKPLFLLFICIIFAVEITLRFFPSSVESMGCQKQFRKNFKATDEYKGERINLGSAKTTFMSAFLWILLNAVIGALFFLGIIDEGILVLIALAYSVCDMICILFFCPFQTWIMKNKCCGSCRIYNWDYAMMFTPLIFIDNIFARSLFILSVILLMRWEVTVIIHPERFSESTNECLSCKNCEEKLCHHKKQLRTFLKDNKDRLQLKGNAIIMNVKSKRSK